MIQKNKYFNENDEKFMDIIHDSISKIMFMNAYCAIKKLKHILIKKGFKNINIKYIKKSDVEPEHLFLKCKFKNVNKQCYFTWKYNPIQF